MAIVIDRRTIDETLNEINNLPIEERKRLEETFRTQVLESLEMYPGFPRIELDVNGRIKNYCELIACYYHFSKKGTLEPIAEMV